ncbi:MAG TPA: S8 family serine peptidase, partial [Myxococcota bacterium]|nr:S8 family serine peptidase [Myxococcota bacterium]
SRPGRVLVAAAGNDGDSQIHVGGTLGDEPVRVELRGLPLGTTTQTLVELWTPERGVVDATVELWVGNSLAASLPLGSNPEDLVSGTLTYGGDTLADVTYTMDAPPEHNLLRHTVLFDREKAHWLPYEGVFVLRLKGKGDVQGWISQTDYASGFSRFGGARGRGWWAGDGVRSVAVPATASRVIAVGSYTVQNVWQSQTDGAQQLHDTPLGSRSAFSSLGPTGFPEFTGFKPDLCAPGSVIVSARAAGVPDSPDTVSAGLMVMQGTSMAAPHVTGVVALMLEANPTLEARQVREILRGKARVDAFTGAVPNYAWGFGKLDALAAVQAVEADARGCAAAGAEP